MGESALHCAAREGQVGAVSALLTSENIIVNKKSLTVSINLNTLNHYCRGSVFIRVDLLHYIMLLNMTKAKSYKFYWKIHEQTSMF